MSRFSCLSMPKVLIVIMILSTSSCSTAGDLDGMPCVSDKYSFQWLGKPFSQAVEKLGAYSLVEEFDLRNSVISEFRGNLVVLFPDLVTDSQPIWIKEVSWDGEVCEQTLWFKKDRDVWIVVDALLWNKNSDF